jgi:hypothetical protein
MLKFSNATSFGSGVEPTTGLIQEQLYRKTLKIQYSCLQKILALLCVTDI